LFLRQIKMRLHEAAGLLLLVTLCHARPGPETQISDHVSEDLIPITQDLSIKLFPFPHLTRTRGIKQRRVGGFFSDNPLISVKRSFQEIQSNVERSMQSLMAAGSELGQRMLGMITRTPRLLLSSSSPAASSAPAPGHHHGQHGENHFPDFTNCDCHFGANSVIPAQFQPVSNDIESYGAPAAPLLESYGSPQAPVAPAYQPVPANNYEAPAPAPAYEEPAPATSAPAHIDHNSLDGPIVDLTNEINEIGEGVISHEPVIHPGGSQDVDYNKVSHIGVQTVVQAASAQVPDQSHPEKYLNHNHDHLLDVVQHNLWRKETTHFKHHHHGEKLRVIPHLTQHTAPADNI